MNRTSIFVSAPLLALALVACSDTTGVNSKVSTDDQLQTTAISASDATVEDVAVLYASDVMLAGSGPLVFRAPQGLSANASWTFDDCPYDQSAGRHVCSVISASGLTMNRDYAFFDGGGAPTPAFNNLTTASVNFHVALSGVHLADAGADSVDRDRNVTVSGLTGEETSRTWNGTGTRDDGGYRMDGDVKRSYHVQDNVTFSNIVVSLPRSEHQWPMSGTITRQLNGSGAVKRGDAERSFSISRTATITFNGTQFVPLTVGGVTYTLDLATGHVVRSQG
jgi:hypothetical protein